MEREQALQARTLRLLEFMRQRKYPNALRVKVRGRWGLKLHGWVIEQWTETDQYMGGRTFWCSVLLSDGTVEENVSERDVRGGAILHRPGPVALLSDEDMVRILFEAGITEVPPELL
jgi:hypothetical protein